MFANNWYVCPSYLLSNSKTKIILCHLDKYVVLVYTSIISCLFQLILFMVFEFNNDTYTTRSTMKVLFDIDH